MQALEVNDLTKQFGGVKAVNNVSFTVDHGQRLAIIGPNGAGKTSLFNLINGQLSPTAGSIYFLGEDVTTLQVHQRAHRGMARAFQIISLLMKLTVLENALLTIHGTRPYRYQMIGRAEKFSDVMDRTEEALQNLGLWNLRSQAVSSLSYGEQRKLEIGLGLAMQPKLFLLDEPSAGLSKEESLEVVDIINGLGKEITVIMVDHDMDMVFKVAERIIVLHQGQVLMDAKPERVKNDQRVKEIYLGVDQ